MSDLFRLTESRKKNETKCYRELGPTVSSMSKPFVHLTKVPELMDVCITGNEKVKPSSRSLPGGTSNSSLSCATYLASSAAI